MSQKPASHPALAASVVKKNVLVPALAGFHLSELRLLAFCLAKLGSTANKSRAITVRVAEMCDLFQMDRPSAYSVIKEVMASIGAKPAEFDIGTKKHLYFWFSSLEYEPDSGEFTFRVSPEMKPFLLELADQFTLYRLADVYRFSSASAWKLYENLAKWRAAGKWSVDLDELRDLLGVAGKYPLWSRLKIDLLDPALEQINSQTDLTVVYEPTKRGRRFTGLAFVIRTLDPEREVSVPESSAMAIARMLKAAGLSAKVVAEYVERFDSEGLTDRIAIKLPAIIQRSTGADKENPVGYIVGALQDELGQLDLFQDESSVPDHKTALDCWTKKRQAGEACTVRERGKTGQRKKCRICLEKLPVAEWGV
jgi:plasmid replication initiation protein